MKALPILSILIAAAALTAALLHDKGNAETKLGFVRTGVLFDKVEITAEAKQKILAEKEEIQGNVAQLEKELAAAHQTFLEEQEKLTKEERQKRVGELAQKERELERYAGESMNRINSREIEIMEPVLQIVNARIERFAKQNGYTLIWGTLNEGNILYGADAADVTDEVVTFVNEQK